MGEPRGGGYNRDMRDSLPETSIHGGPWLRWGRLAVLAGSAAYAVAEAEAWLLTGK